MKTRPRGPWTAMARTLLGGFVLALAIALGLSGPGGVVPEPATPTLVIDANTAPPGVLGALPRLGPVLVGRVVEAREKAPFRSLGDLDARVKGVGPVTIEGLRPHLSFEPPE